MQLSTYIIPNPKLNMRKLLVAIFALTLTSLVAASPLWMRYNSISPDGSTIAFTYKGDIYTVDANGGTAKQLTVTPYYEKEIIWSPDSKTIAFAADRKGTFSVYTMPAQGGVPERLTFNSTSELPVAFSPDGKEIYFTASYQKAASNVQFTARWMKELYSVPVKGGRPTQIVDVPVMHLSFDKDGKSFYYENRTGSENEFRKHHVSSVARDIWYYNANAKTHTQITQNVGEDRSPILLKDGTLLFLSERNKGSFNIYQSPVSATPSAKALTKFSDNPIRFLSAANNGTLCFGFRGEIYTQKNGKNKKVSIQIINTVLEDPVVAMNARSGEEYSMTPSGDQIIFAKRGEIFATTDKYTTTKQITHTAAAERGISISPDGRTIVYASERSGMWQLYTASMKNNDEINFANATEIEEKPIFKNEKVERFAPQYSPDGKKIAYIENRRQLKVVDVKTKKVTQITSGDLWYTNDDYGFEFSWSPNSEWIALTIITNRRDPYSDIAIASVKGDGKIYNITESAYFDSAPQWALDGNAITYSSNRLGLRAHASWGSQEDVFIAFLNRETMDKFQLSEEELDVQKAEKKRIKENKEKADKKDKKSKKDKKKADKKTKKESKKLDIDFAHLQDRILRLTPMSSNLGSYTLSKDGEKLFFTAAYNDTYDLWEYNTRDRSSKILTPSIGRAYIHLDKKGKNLFAFGRRCQKISTSNGRGKGIKMHGEFQFDLAKERTYMFNHMFRQQEKLFYNKNYHGVNLPGLQKEYARFLPHINNNYDYTDMLSEILGELNVSHTGSGYFAPYSSNDDATGQFGALLDIQYKGDGLKVEEILEHGPLDHKASKVEKGTIIEAVNGKKIVKDKDYFALLNHTIGKKVQIECYNPETGKRWKELVKPMSASMYSELMYRRWIKNNEKMTEKLSKGRLGYVHIRSMGDASYRDIYSEILGKYNECDGIVIDTRYNGGGRLHEDIEILFSGHKYLEQCIQGRVACEMPSRRYNKPSIMLVAEANYSNAHGTPWVYQTMGIGKIVGMPIPGTMTSVRWERLQDRSMYFGIPIIGYRTQDGSYLENKQLEPDFKVRNQPEMLIQGRDQQLEKAVEELLKDVKANTKNRW